MKNLVVISAGLSVPSSTRRLADTISSAVQMALAERGEELAVTTIELRELARDLAEHMVTGSSSAQLDAVKRQLSGADGLVAVTPVFKASYTGLFKMFFDSLDREALVGMPSIIAATGGSSRHSLITEYALRPLLTYMHAVVVPTALFSASDTSEAEHAFSERVNKAAGELAGLVAVAQGAEGEPGTDSRHPSE